MSRGFLAFPRAEFLGLTMLTWLAMLLVVVFILALRGTRLARDLFAAGGNPHAAEFSGIDAGRAQFIAYTLCGAIAGVCGYLWVARFAVAYTDIALGFELSVIAACLIGGVSIAGGVGSAVGVLLGCLFIGIIRSSLPLVGISAFWQMFINGAVILVAVLLSARQRDVQRTILEARP
jgi:rhamnose transport system permease protein